MADEKKSFIVYENWATLIANIPEEQAGEIFKAMCCKKIGTEYSVKDPVAAGIFTMISEQMDADNEKYQAKCEKNRAIAEERERKKHERNTNEHERARTCENDARTYTDNDNDNDNDINKIPAESMNVNYQEIVDSYHELCPDLPKVTKLSDARRKAIRARLRTYSIEDIKKAFELAGKSDFLLGKNNRNWSATFDWILKDTNMAKILDGNYNNRGRPVQRSDITGDPAEAPTSSQEDIDRIARAMRKRGAY